ncbi:MAG TPA: lipopolysaccharide heptosyltransferase II [Candidatus Hydrogenedentes bacterium]|nr:lipopolysaccharide heptosyltransferase II [Candidatus Hydrogenedentota bacterium]HRZ80917.1 lipopolysaccharide heptosyltransferase II [Candidatus Hydrogenedentota bacterium]
MRCAAPEALLALAPNWVGDAVMCTPALRALKNAHPRARLTVAGRDAVCSLLEGLPWVDALHPLPARPGVVELFRHARLLAPAARDMAVVFPHSFRAALLARLAGARRRVGHDRNGRGFLLTERVAPHRVDGRITPVYMAFEYLDVAEAAGGTRDDLGPELAAPAALRAELAERFTGEGPLVAFAPGAAFGPSKRWPAERFASLADRLRGQCGARCVLLTGPGEEDTRRAVLDAARHPLLECPRQGLDMLKAAVSLADLLVGNDSGPRHIAVAFGKPVVCLMGPTSPAYTESPWERGRVLRIDVDCGPCQQPVCATDHRCMTGISVDRAAEAALEALGQPARGARPRDEERA